MTGPGGFRPPVVAGVSGGVGTSTVALALHGRDAGAGATGDADVIVCRSSVESLERAARIADLLDPALPAPILAVTIDGAERRRPERLQELDPGWSGVVLLPHVARWRSVFDPYREAAGLLGTPPDQLPRVLRPYLLAVTRLARTVAGTGRLTGPAPAAPRSAPAHPERRSPGPRPARRLPSTEPAAPAMAAIAQAAAAPEAVGRDGDPTRRPDPAGSAAQNPGPRKTAAAGPVTAEPRSDTARSGRTDPRPELIAAAAHDPAQDEASHGRPTGTAAGGTGSGVEHAADLTVAGTTGDHARPPASLVGGVSPAEPEVDPRLAIWDTAARTTSVDARALASTVEEIGSAPRRRGPAPSERAKPETAESEPAGAGPGPSLSPELRPVRGIRILAVSSAGLPGAGWS
ncbi:hypothetical protein GCM10009836_57500 [Pseudonocardia ailaonensis]|uniref:Uncharacterized protein n=1 Tax=Pseudonocardia ailaonensis TaxID=367279 RepID=A0ABN2NHE4_9PSEU